MTLPAAARPASLLVIALAAIALLTIVPLQSHTAQPSAPLQVSGIYPHLAVFNDTGDTQDNECGIGAIVPWAGKLWLITYPPHRRTGSADKLHEIDAGLQMTVRPESVGGTHAGRMIHAESQQLIIGPYFIDANGAVRAVDQRRGFPARITGITRHLTDPVNKVYMFDMEGPIWEVDVHTLVPKRIFVKPVPGWHGKGAYTSQGRLIIANNGERRTNDLAGLRWELPESQWSRGVEDNGALAEYDGRDWTIVSRRAHTEVTGPGGLRGERDAPAPVWSVGWDRRSLLLHVRSRGVWSVYRLPKGSYTYDPPHGWFTEWPRIRAIGDGPLLLNMHGTFFDFPVAFDTGHSGGIRPLGTHLHYTTDFTEWQGRVVLAGDDTSIQQNALAAKPQSNLRFITRSQLATDFGPRSGWGGVWVDDPVAPGAPSDPFLIAGYTDRYIHLSHDLETEVAFTIEIDERGDGAWQAWRTITVASNGYASLLIPRDVKGEWLRVLVNRACVATAFLHLTTPRSAVDDVMRFAALARAGAADEWIGGLLRPAGFSRDLQFLARTMSSEGRIAGETYYEVNERLELTPIAAPARAAALKKIAEPTADYTMDAASVVVTDDEGRRWRLPRRFPAIDAAGTRGIREVVSERYLAQLDGTFYEIPRHPDRTVPDFRRMKPIASHAARIADFATWRGLLVLAGTSPRAQPDGHFFRAADGRGGLWFGAIDDLYALGTPRGKGGPWKDTHVRAGEPSDPYLMTGFEHKVVTLTHDQEDSVRFTIAVDVIGDGSWRKYTTIDVPAKESIAHRFPDGFSAHWVRLVIDRSATATAWFDYEPAPPQ